MNKWFTMATCLLLGGTLQAQEIQQEQISLITKKTATWCPTCGGQAWGSFLDMIDENGDKAISIAAHFSSASELYSSTAAALVSNFQSSPGQPVFYYNSTRLNGRGSATVQDVTERVSNAFEQTPLVGLGLEAAFENGQFTVAYALEFLEATTGDYQIGFYPIRKSVIANQASRGSNADHKQILDEALLDANFGIPVSSGDIAVGSTVQQRLVINAAGYTDDIDNENLELAVIVWKKVGDNDYEYINAAVTDVMAGTLSDVETFNKTEANLEIRNIGGNTVSLALTNNAVLENAQLNIYSMDGRLLATPLRGRIATGTRQVQFAAEAGVYIAHLFVDGKQLSKKFIIQ
ncbi:MAG: T9SS type A sorting domain-containing protein [Bacteroidota bacterium]